ncbi:MAG: hypothetical protein HRJ53_15460, partial [Acidobacteria bacterium Pan2503]|nr:hypothetical protein [Candidatus Acidoferrum panamensis]
MFQQNFGPYYAEARELARWETGSPEGRAPGGATIHIRSGGEGGAIPPAAPERGFTTETKGGAEWAVGPGGTYRVSIQPGMSDELIRSKLQEQADIHKNLFKPPPQPGTPERPPPTDVEAIPYTKPMPIPAARRFGLSLAGVLHHELGHLIIAVLNGFETQGIASHNYPRTKRLGGGASALTKTGAFRDSRGKVDPNLIAGKELKFLDLYAAGAAANELVDGIHRSEQEGTTGDRRGFDEVLDALKITNRDDREALWHQSIDRNMDRMRGMEDAIRFEASRREDNLSVQFHFSEARAKHIGELVKRGEFGTPGQRALEAAGQGTLFGGAPPGPAGRYPPGVTGAAGANAPERLRKYPGAPKNIYFVKIVTPDRLTYTVTAE